MHNLKFWNKNKAMVTSVLKKTPTNIAKHLCMLAWGGFLDFSTKQYFAKLKWKYIFTFKSHDMAWKKLCHLSFVIFVKTTFLEKKSFLKLLWEEKQLQEEKTQL